MVLVSYINPLSDEGKQIARENGSLDEIFDENDILWNLIQHTHSQELLEIPESYGDLAIKRMERQLKKNSKNYSFKDYIFLLNPEIAKFDVVAFYVLAQAIALKFGPNSRESRYFVESQGSLIDERLERMKNKDKYELIDKVLNALIIEDEIHWTDLGDILGSKRISLSKIILDKGEVILDKDDFLSRFDDLIVNRPSEKMYNLLVGYNLKQLVIKSMIMDRAETYIQKVKDLSSNVLPHPNLIKIAVEISNIMQKETSYFGGSSGNIKGSALQVDAFPPCITNTLAGVGSGNRNDAIVLLLTSFLSYARLYPSIFKNKSFVKISDLDPELKITTNELLPLIYEAAEKCSPPLFEDDPQEKLNIVAKLGFGVYEDLKVEHEGESKWYTPMSCEKIKIHLSSLCKPDANCKKIGNPLSYYNRKTWQLKNSNMNKKIENNKQNKK